MSQIKIIKQTFLTAQGYASEWSVLIDDVPKKRFNSEEELEAFLWQLKRA